MKYRRVTWDRTLNIFATSDSAARFLARKLDRQARLRDRVIWTKLVAQLRETDG